MTNTSNSSTSAPDGTGNDAQGFASTGELARHFRTHGVPTQTRFAFTPTGLDALRCCCGRYEVWDTLTSGLGLRITPSKKSWCFMFTIPGTASRARLALGTYPSTTVKDARTRATEARGLVEAGTDPRAALAPAEAPKTIAQMIEERLAMKLRGKKRRASDTEWRYNKYVIPLIGNVAVKDFKVDPHYNKVVDPILKRGKMRMAGMIYQDLNGLFNFAIQRGVLEFSRMAQVDRPDTYVPRERFLSADEIKTLWGNAPSATRSKGVQMILKLLLATGQRLQEVVGISRGEIDLKAATWTLPKARAKNNCQHVIPLNAVALGILKDAMRETNGDFLFPKEGAEGPRNGRDVDRTVAEARKLGKFGVDDWTPHDLRRTVATHMSKLGVPHLAISHVLNHITNTKATVTQAVYDKHDYLAEKREAIDKWGTFLSQLVAPEAMRMAAE